MDTIELLIDEEEGKMGVFAISLVDFPAIESNFVALSKHDVKLKVMDEEKRLVLGIILKPNKDIYRKNGDYEYNIRFSEETVRKASQLYLREMRNKNTTLHHEIPVEGAYMVESWIVEDPEKDKTAIYGLNAAKGDWAGSMKIENDDIWERVKEGDVMGFSIEGLFDEKPILDYKAKYEQIMKILQS